MSGCWPFTRMTQIGANLQGRGHYHGWGYGKSNKAVVASATATLHSVPPSDGGGPAMAASGQGLAI